MIEILVKAEVLIVGSQTIDVILWYEDDVINERSSACNAIYPFKSLFL